MNDHTRGAAAARLLDALDAATRADVALYTSAAALHDEQVRAALVAAADEGSGAAAGFREPPGRRWCADGDS